MRRIRRQGRPPRFPLQPRAAVRAPLCREGGQGAADAGGGVEGRRHERRSRAQPRGRPLPLPGGAPLRLRIAQGQPRGVLIRHRSALRDAIRRVQPGGGALLRLSRPGHAAGPPARGAADAH